MLALCIGAALAAITYVVGKPLYMIYSSFPDNVSHTEALKRTVSIVSTLVLTLTCKQQHPPNENRSQARVPGWYEVHYKHKGEEYIYTFKERTGPPSVIQVLDQDDEDCTDEVRPYLGPNEDFHLQPFKPDFFDRSSLTFMMNDSKDLVFEKDTVINIRSKDKTS